MSAKPARPLAPPPTPDLTAAEMAAITRARAWLLTPRTIGTRRDDDYDAAARSALVELNRANIPDSTPQPPAEPDLPPIAASLGAVPVWVRTGTTGMYPVLARRALGLFEENE